MAGDKGGGFGAKPAFSEGGFEESVLSGQLYFFRSEVPFRADEETDIPFSLVEVFEGFLFPAFMAVGNETGVFFYYGEKFFQGSHFV